MFSEIRYKIPISRADFDFERQRRPRKTLELEDWVKIMNKLAKDNEWMDKALLSLTGRNKNETSS